jgi:hypothetical protein
MHIHPQNFCEDLKTSYKIPQKARVTMGPTFLVDSKWVTMGPNFLG